ncbi:TauD/TfdA family dioxygenase [Roseibium sp. RKSG952]|uniref:TauD/TfdA family dioxygenase n=1 Tax=Roseibium sp. RKSG952 TaxID=2529384 RepID=UPI0012BCBA3E|nr:TauD/TfdA family dioxygenase [Roseibium sp. RKSG952]MTH98852.1 gamma-butyrobetaine,2-oxoglutarate dioxygenase [Roseibium sp. RKSG952]
MLGTGKDGVLLRENGLDVPLANGKLAYFNAYWLRDNCPSSFDRVTRERVYDIFAEAVPPRIKEAWISGAFLEITWDNSQHKSRFPLTFLASYANGEKRADIARVTRVPWYSDHYPKIARFAQCDLASDRTRVGEWAHALLQDGLALISDMPDTDDALLQTAGLLGHVRPSYFGQVFEVKTHANPTNLAFTSQALELHTDLPSEDFAPGVQFLHCRANSATGGASLFVDGLSIAQDFRERYPEDFDLLVNTDVPYYCEHDTFDMRARQRVIELDEHGAISGVTISQHQADIFDLPQRDLDRYYPAFCRFGRMMQDEKYLMRFRLKAGECIAFDNHRIVHGRAAYVANSGDRHLRGCYIDRGELRSTYRVIAGEGRFR